jgi:hypothetical protein
MGSTATSCGSNNKPNSCSNNRAVSEKYYQELDGIEPLSGRTNIKSSTLFKSIKNYQNETVYCYIVNTLAFNNDGHLVNSGSGPNTEGGRITLCTCKHWMRTFKTPEDWKGVWIAGFTGIGVGNRGNQLYYLMRVGAAFTNHSELWYEGNLKKDTLQAKQSSLNRLGRFI